MPCNCKETRKVKTCPTVSVEETILTELRNFYNYVVAKFTEVIGYLTADKPALVYSFLDGSIIANNAMIPITTPDKMVSLIVEVTGLPTLEDPTATVDLIAPDATVVWNFAEKPKA
jgi:hypothetical protein